MESDVGLTGPEHLSNLELSIRRRHPPDQPAGHISKTVRRIL